MMARLTWVTKRPVLLYLLYLAVVLGSYFLVMNVWKETGVFVTQRITFAEFAKMASLYSLGAVVVPWIYVTLQAVAVWLTAQLTGRSSNFKATWIFLFWTFVIPLASREALSNLVLFLARKPIPVNFGLGAFFAVPTIVDRMTDLATIMQVLLFFLYFNPEQQFDKRTRWLLTSGLVAGTFVAGLFF